MKNIMDNFNIFIITWIIILLLNQIFIFGACFAPYCLLAALPHTGIIAALLTIILSKLTGTDRRGCFCESDWESSRKTKPLSKKQQKAKDAANAKFKEDLDTKRRLKYSKLTIKEIEEKIAKLDKELNPPPKTEAEKLEELIKETKDLFNDIKPVKKPTGYGNFGPLVELMGLRKTLEERNKE